MTAVPHSMTDVEHTVQLLLDEEVLELRPSWFLRPGGIARTSPCGATHKCRLRRLGVGVALLVAVLLAFWRSMTTRQDARRLAAEIVEFLRGAAAGTPVLDGQRVSLGGCMDGSRGTSGGDATPGCWLALQSVAVV